MSVALLLVAGTVSATVGGPTNAFGFKFDSKSNSVYYQLQNFGGRGCPPILMALSVPNNTTKEIIPCDDENPTQERIQAITGDLPTIHQIHLRKNNISVSIEEKGAEYWEGTEELMRQSFVAHIFQNNTKVGSIPFSGCSLEQPIVIDGYSVPSAADTIVFLFSTKSDCFEGGYVSESLHAVSGITITPDTAVYAYKSNQSLAPHEGSLVIYPATTENKAPIDPVIIGAVAFLLGIVVTWLIKKK